MLNSQIYHTSGTKTRIICLEIPENNTKPSRKKRPYIPMYEGVIGGGSQNFRLPPLRI